jgi:hypothetical protein
MSAEQIGMCLYTLKLKFARFGNSFGAALANRDPKSTLKNPCLTLSNFS